MSGFEDWMGTIAEMLELETSPESTDGVSLVKTLKGEEQPERPFLYREFSGYGGQQSIRVGDWKAIRQNMNKGNVKLELYDLASDKNESINVAEQNSEMVAKLEQLMTEQHVKSELYPLRPFDAPALKPKKPKKPQKAK